MPDLSSFYRRSHRYTGAILDFIYPSFCIICSKRIESSPKFVCQECWTSIPRLRQPADLDFDDLHIDRFQTIWAFDDTVQKIIHEVKFFGKKSLGKRLGEELATVALADSRYARADLIVPVPLHRTKRRERGFNQSAVLSESVSRALNIPVVTTALKRIRYTRPQSKLTAVEREKNVRGAFQAGSSNELKKKTVILIDDVLTTGSTVRACSEVLKKAGVANVYALTVAATL
ncbi:MAG: ComF family protein [bacterium]